MRSDTVSPSAHVTVWRIDVTAHEPRLAALEAMLSDDERRRAARFMQRQDAVRSIVARGSLRLLLGRATGMAPQDLSFSYGPLGKPALAGPAPCVHFNLSHSGDVVLVALSSDCPVLGVDVERIRPLSDAEGMAEYVLTPRERAVYEALDAIERPRAFFRAWTCKEALAKATGEGLGLGLGRFEVSLVPQDVPQVLAVDGQAEAARAWRLLDVDVPPGYAAALAVRAADVKVALRDLPASRSATCRPG